MLEAQEWKDSSAPPDPFNVHQQVLSALNAKGIPLSNFISSPVQATSIPNLDHYDSLLACSLLPVSIQNLLMASTAVNQPYHASGSPALVTEPPPVPNSLPTSKPPSSPVPPYPENTASPTSIKVLSISLPLWLALLIFLIPPLRVSSSEMSSSL